ncbi:glycosyltransferase [Bacteroides reticulotermitis]|uniref:glycosyltransferase n=1 Tax=Bacteroides reticulotermitis TaxID=1133319 RepID=UPI003A8A314B
MRVLHIAECAGGVERYLLMLLPLLKKAGVEQVLVCSENYDEKTFKLLSDKIVQIKMSQTLSPFVVLKEILDLRAIIKENEPDIVYCHSSLAGGLGRLAAIGLTCRVVYNPHGWAFNMK